MNDRVNRYSAFDQFRDKAQELFEAYANSTTKSERLGKLYSFYVSPGGRYGGVNKKIVEIFYGNRPFDSVMEISADFRTSKKLETAHGATLLYQRTDDGQVLCSLYPAASQNFHYPEDFILLDIVKNPTKLIKKSKRHWRMFQAYMESTCLDGSPSFSQKILAFYLRNFKKCVVKETLQKRRAYLFFSEIAKYVVTVGLSGFIIFLITWSKEPIDNSQVIERHREALIIYSEISDSVQAIAKSSKAIEGKIDVLDQATSESLKSLNLAISESASRIEKAVIALKEGNETESNKAQNAGE